MAEVNQKKTVPEQSKPTPPLAARRNDQKVGQSWLLPPNPTPSSQPWYRWSMDAKWIQSLCRQWCLCELKIVCRFFVTFSPLSSMVEWVLRCKIECWIRLYHNCSNKKCIWSKTSAGMPPAPAATRRKSTAISKNITAMWGFFFVSAAGGHCFCMNACILDYVYTICYLATP